MSFKQDYYKKLKTTLVKLDAIENELSLVFYSTLSPTLTRKKIDALRKQSERLFSKMYATVEQFNNKNQASLYRNMLKGIETKFKSKRKLIKNISSSKNTLAFAELLALETNAKYKAITYASMKKIDAYLIKTKQFLLSEKDINLALLSGLNNEGNLQKVMSILNRSFQKKLLDDYKNGKFMEAGSRSFKPSTYAKLLARTRFHELQSIASLKQAKNYDTDLVKVSSHNTTTKICLPYEGQIFSVSGKSKKYPRLTDVPPYHPNCLHNLYPVFQEAL